jgi:hypothetical protein
VADLVTLIVHSDEADPQVFEALHMFSGCASSHVYLLFFWAWADIQLRNKAPDNKSPVALTLSLG